MQATTGTAVTLAYSYGMGTIGYNFYNQLGQLVASISPEGVKKLLGSGINNYSSKEQVPFITLYSYDVQGRLVSVKEPDATGDTKFVYRKDGNIRFSQNAVQRATGKYSYTHYDVQGRPVESGEYRPGAGGIAFASTAMANILENTSANGGLTNGTQYDVVRSRYDVVDDGHGLTAYQQDSYFQRGGVSVTEKYSTVVNNAPMATNLVSRTWYGYDGQGRVIWTVAYLNGLTGYKTTDYSYDELGNVTKKIYQKNTAAECFVHYYEYDADRRLSAVYTNTTDNTATRRIQARYHYYLTGALKRMELGDKLQGIDYTYTVDGKLKAINHANPVSDPGNDGTGNGFAADVFGMNVEYHPNDYVRSGSDVASIQHASYPAAYNGNINGISWNTKKPSSVTGQDGTVMNTYRYDAKNQLTGNGWGTPNFTSHTYTETANVNKEYGLTYDGNGNIQTLKRNGPSGTTTANYSYSYTTNTNKLASVSGYASYTYDALGRLASETKGGQTRYLGYDVTGMVTKICSDAAMTQIKFSFVYDEAGRRIKKQDHTNGAVTWYVYDGAGQLAAIYDNLDGGSTVKLKEQPVYAGSRIGIYFRQANNYQYQLSDHLGNVRAVINGTKLGNGNADVVFYADYYPFGTVLRSGGTGWRYGYQGEYAEKDEETGWNSFELRNYDAEIGRWLSVDPYGQYASPYVGMGNSPLVFVDTDGGWAGGDDPKTYAGDPLSEVVINVKRMAWNERIMWRESLNMDPFKFVSDGRIDYEALYERQRNASYREKMSAVWDPQKAIYDGVMFYATGELGGVVGKWGFQGGKWLVSRAMSRFAAETGGRVFWSGGNTAKNAAEAFAKSNGMKTLEMTTGGRIMTTLNPVLPRSISSPIWNRMSANFANGARGSVNVFHNATDGIRLNSVWRTTEYPILNNNNVNIFYHNVFR